MFWLLVHLILYGPAGFRDETLAAYADRGATYHLVETGGAPVASTVTLRFPQMWQLEARTPCFVYRAKITVPYPWFAIAGLNGVEHGCIHTEFEAAFVDGLQQATLSEVHGSNLILTADDGFEMVFEAQK